MFRIALASAAALALTAAPAAAQSAPYFAASKTYAILGGESRLAAIMAQQSGQPAPAVAPASYGAPMVQAVMPAYRPAISMTAPDVFNSVALPIGHTTLDRRWKKVENGPVGTASGAYAASLNGRDAMAKLIAVNHYVNSRVSFVDDIKQYGVSDLWTSAAQTLSRGRGDCEDYAIAKMQLLRRAGFAEKDLYLVILRDALRRADHAVLVARADNRLLVLDNGTDRLIDSFEMVDYHPIVTFSGNHVWTHGYRRELPPVTYASNEKAITPPVTIAAAAGVVAVTPGASAN
jgi:predicted transglutaminase-like cysteine proteinase